MIDTILKVNGQEIHLPGTSGFIATIDKESPTEGTVQMEYSIDTPGEAISLLKEVLMMFKTKTPGIVENALKDYFEELGMLSSDGSVHIVYHKPKSDGG